jgi:hypothetical protein
VEAAYTQTQGQYLAFIYYYSKIHGVPPAEADLQRYFKVSPPAIHQMIVTLDKRSFIDRTPGVGRSIRLRLSRDQLPDLVRSQRHDELAWAALHFRDGAKGGSSGGIQIKRTLFSFRRARRSPEGHVPGRPLWLTRLPDAHPVRDADIQ